ncbi:DUF1697 domain-containing protein [Paenibacillus sp.]|uniref:DUF1697 domain-containing protein n=1 Tax=Paenibacillus sp. TaxID=58172 RepID=UPI00281187BF|nr:DUF1697 domain-containing protein [Paenibacillus sp.]
MTGYIALLRGINVGGNNIVKMEELRAALASNGLSRVRTYIQSGNIVCETSDGSEEKVREIVAETLRSMLEKPIAVLVRSFEELERIMAACPYEVHSSEEGKQVMLALLQEAIPQEKLDAALAGGPGGDAGDDEYTAGEREVYFRFRRKVSESPLGDRMLKLGGGVTTRNWNTMRKLLEMSRE